MMTQATTITLDPAFRVAPVNRRTFGSFVEHLGRCVYTGIFEPEHPSADTDGFRSDVIELVKELGVSTVRYPGGNFVSGYRWEDGVGPKSSRPTRHDLAWHSTEPNTFGLDEFMKWTRKANIEPMMAVNLGTRGIQEALDILEYCNAPTGTHLSDQRAANGHPEPYKIKMWCLGNEMDGPWQIGHKTATEYARLAAETANAMRMEDTGLELVACGSSSSYMDTFGAWEATVLEETYDQVDLVSAHVYYAEEDNDLGSFLASAENMDHFIDSVVATADAVRAKLKRTKRIMVSFDEWNVWYQKRAESKLPAGDDWPIAPVLLEDHYNVADAVVVGNCLISLLRHSDRVTSASQAQLVNVIAPIMTEPGGRAWRQTIFYPFAQASAFASGEVLQVALDSPTYTTAKFGDVRVVDSVATWNADSGILTIFAVNRSTSEAAPVNINLHAFPQFNLLDFSTLTHVDPYMRNSADAEVVAPQPNQTGAVTGESFSAQLPPVSWNVIRLQVKSN